MEVPPSTPRKRARSASSDISRLQDVDFPSPSPKKPKRVHRWIADDPELVEQLNKARLATPRTPPNRAVRTADENGVTIIAGKRTHQQFSEDLMDEDKDDSESEFEFPKISTPMSVKGFVVYVDQESPEVQQPVSSSPVTTSNTSPAPYSTSNVFESRQYHTSATTSASHLDGSFLDKAASDESTADDADDERSDGDQDFEDIVQTSDPGSDSGDSSIWVRKRTSYGIVLAPTKDSSEQGYETSSDEREPLVGDDPSTSSGVDSSATLIHHGLYQSTHEWNEREEVVFRALVWDYGRKWVRFLPSFPYLTIDEIEAHFRDLVAAHPDWNLDKVADKADSGEGNSSIIWRSGHWHTFATGSDRLVLEGRAIPRAWI